MEKPGKRAEVLMKVSPYSKALWRYYKAKSIIESIINYKDINNGIMGHSSQLKDFLISGISHRGGIIVNKGDASYVLKGIPPYVQAWAFDVQTMSVKFIHKNRVFESPYDKGFFLAL